MTCTRLAICWLAMILGIALAAPAASGPVEDLALVEAVKRGDEPLVFALLDAGADVGFVLPDPHYLPLSVVEHAAHHGHRRLIHKLLNRGAPLRHSAQRGLVLAGLALRQTDDPALIRALWRRLERAHDPRPHFRGPLIEAARQGHVETLRWLLAQGVDPHWSDPGAIHPRPAVVEAARHGQFEAVNLLVEAGAEPDPEVGEDVLPPLHAAAHFGAVETVQLLLYLGADPTRETAAGNALTAASCAPTLGHVDHALDHAVIVALLLERGVDPNVANDTRSPLACARRAGEPRVIALLEGAGGEERETLRAQVRRGLGAVGYLIGSD